MKMVAVFQDLMMILGLSNANAHRKENGVLFEVNARAQM